MASEYTGRKRVAVIDAANVLFQQYHSFKGIEFDFPGFGRGYTGIVFGAFEFIKRLIDNAEVDGVVFVLEGDQSYNPRRKDPIYKSNRPAKTDKGSVDITTEIRIVRSFLNHLGGYVVTPLKGEADDGIGNIVNRLKKDEECDVMILSSDHDMFQLLDQNVFVIRSPINSFSTVFRRIYKMNTCPIETMYSVDKFIRMYGYHPRLYRWWLAVRGDTSDKIPGVVGFGDVKTKKMFDAICGRDAGYPSKISLKEVLDYLCSLNIATTEREEYEQMIGRSMFLAKIRKNWPIEIEVPKRFNFSFMKSLFLYYKNSSTFDSTKRVLEFKNKSEKLKENKIYMRKMLGISNASEV